MRACTGTYACMQVHVLSMGDEMRVGFTDNKDALLERRRMSYREPHAWLYSDGSAVRGVFGGGRCLFDATPAWRAEAHIAVRLDFDADEASWFLELGSPTEARHVYTLRGLPAGPLYPAVVLDAAGDAVVFDPSLPADVRARGELLVRL